MNPIKKLSLLLSALLVGGLCFPAAASDFTVRTAGTLPPPASGGVKNPGVAGAFIGGIGDRIVVAGGSNFAQGAPWDGGAKQFHHLLTSADSGQKQTCAFFNFFLCHAVHPPFLSPTAWWS